MELNHKNFNGEIVLARKFNLIKQFFGKTIKMTFKNESDELFLH